MLMDHAIRFMTYMERDYTYTYTIKTAVHFSCELAPDNAYFR
jgi:hypothetical protein